MSALDRGSGSTLMRDAAGKSAGVRRCVFLWRRERLRWSHW